MGHSFSYWAFIPSIHTHKVNKNIEKIKTNVTASRNTEKDILTIQWQNVMMF